MRTNAVSMIKGLLVAIAIVVVMGCSGQPLSTREKGTFIGTGVGAATGAIIGAAVGNPLAGAAIGGGIGALGGYAVGNEMQNKKTPTHRPRRRFNPSKGRSKISNNRFNS